MKSGTKIHRYTEEQDQFLLENRDKFTFKELANEFNAKFRTSRTRGDLEYRCRSKKLGQGKINKYSKEQLQFLRENLNSYSYKELTALFNKKFKTKVSLEAIRSQVFQALGTKNGKVIGDEASSSGYVWVKTSDKRGVGTSSKSSKPNWTLKHRLIYENAHGEIPEGNLIVFLDKNKNNFELDNLYCIDKRINTIMNKNRWFSTDPDLTLAAIKYCELFYALKQN